MFEQILKELKTKYKDLGLSESILKAFAKKLTKAVKDESEIDSAVAEIEDDLRIYQSLTDQNRTLQKEIADLKNAKPADKADEKPANENPEPPKGGEDMPEWAKSLIESTKSLSEGLSALKAEKTNQSNSEKLTSKLKELGVNENFYGLMIDGKTFENDEQIFEFAQSVKEKENAYIQSTNDGKLKDTAKTPSGGKAQVEGEVSQDVQDYIKTKFKTNEAN